MGCLPQKEPASEGREPRRIVLQDTFNSEVATIVPFEAVKIPLIGRSPTRRAQNCSTWEEMWAATSPAQGPPIYTSNVQGQAFHTEDEMIDMNYSRVHMS